LSELQNCRCRFLQLLPREELRISIYNYSTHTTQVGSQEISFLAAQPLGNHVGGFLSTPNLGTVSLNQPSATNSIYCRSYPHVLSLGTTTKHFSDAGWPPVQSDCDSPIYGYQLQSAVTMTCPQPCGTIYPTHSIRAWSSLNERPINSIPNGTDKEQQGSALSYLGPDTGTRSATSAEGASPFNVVALQSSLPRASAANRQLPVPTTGMRQMALPHNTESAPLHLYPAFSNTNRESSNSFYNSGGIWASEQFSPDFRSGSIASSVSGNQSDTAISVTTANTSHTSPQSYAETNGSPDSSPTSLPEVTASASIRAPSAVSTGSTLSQIDHYDDSVSLHAVPRNNSTSNVADYQYPTPKLNPVPIMQCANDTVLNAHRYETATKPRTERIPDPKPFHREFWENSATAMGETPLSVRGNNY